MKRNLMLLFVFFSCVAHAQESSDNNEKAFSTFSVGLGMGLDFGGFLGTRLMLSPSKSIGLFAGLGANRLGFGFNGGMRFRLIPDKRVNPTILVMYGSNGVITSPDTDKYDNVYYGFTLGGGIQLNSKKSLNHWSFELLIPFRSQQFYDDWKEVESLQSYVGPIPISFSVGYHWSLH